MKPILVLSVAVSVSLSARASAFNAQTHRAMNEAAVNTDSSFNHYLTTDIGLPGGSAQVILGEKVITWVSDGGEREDDLGLVPRAPGRFMAHFHDPLVNPWTDAGLFWAGSGTVASTLWMQNDANDWSWQHMREQYHLALTSGPATARDLHWTNTFRGVGQIMHLIEDAGVPEHTRNDSHGDEYVRRLFNLTPHGSFEYWVSDPTNAAAFSYSVAVPFDRNILYQPTGHSEAPLPVARLIDTDAYDGSDPNVTLQPAIGLGEFSNANFFSQGTIPGPRQYPHPNANTLEPAWQLNLASNTIRQYYEKAPSDGFQVGPLAVASVFGDVCPVFSVDDVVWGATAGVVVPKAVDYAQGALDYFFRGKIDFVPDPDDPNGFLIKNLGPDDMSGTFKLYYDDANGNRQLVPGSNGWQLSILAAQHCANGGVCNQASVQAFDVQFDPPPSGTYTLVFHGTMGEETPSDGSLGGVAGKVVQASPFVLYTESGVYQSAFLDHGWQRVASSGAGTTTGWPLWLSHADHISPELLFLSFNIGVLKSGDGGRTFTNVSDSLVPGEYVTGVSYLGGKRLIAITEGFTTASSDDLGVSWSLTPGPALFASGGWWPDAFAYVGGGTLYAGAYAGIGSNNNWSAQSGPAWSPFTPIPLAVDGIALQTCLFDGACFYSTFDTFHVQAIAWNQKEGGEQVALAYVTYEKGENLSVSGAGYSAGGILKSTDGANWRSIPALGAASGAPAIATDGTALAIVSVPSLQGPYTERNALYKSFDAGETWQPAAEPPDSAWEFPGTGGGLLWLGSGLPPP